MLGADRAHARDRRLTSRPPTDLPAPDPVGAPGGDRLRSVTEIVRTRHFGRVAEIELHRPEVRHAMNTDLLRALIGALGGAASEGETGAVVVTGSDRCFSSGADVSEDIGREAAQARMGMFAGLYE